MRTCLIMGIFFLACANDAPLYQNNYARNTDYKIAPETVTPHGVAVDRSGFEVELSDIDLVIDRAEVCLAKHFAEIDPYCVEQKKHCQPILKEHSHSEFWKCYDIMVGCNKYDRVKNGFDRSRFRVKIAPDWRYACDGQTMVFPCGVDPKPCRDKGLEPTPECPCSCRSTIQDSDIITTPQLIILAGELVRLTTGFNNPWNVPALENCANIIP